jgi:hypothetical protein
MRGVLRVRALPILLVVGGLTVDGSAGQERPTDGPFTVEYYYRIRWGHVDEWMELYRKNHYPVLVREMELGRIVHMFATVPVNHAGEDARWDFRFTIVWRSASDAYDRTFDSGPIIDELYPDRGTFEREEQRRFQLLEAHMDVPVTVDDLRSWATTPPAGS